MNNVFVGQTVSAGIVYTSLYSVDDANQTHLVFDPNVTRLQATGYGDFLPGSFVVMGEDLYFQVAYSSGLGAGFTSTSYLVRLDADGAVSVVTQMPEDLSCFAASQGLDPVDTIIATPEGLVMTLVTPPGLGPARPPADIWTYAATEGFAVAGDFTRPGYSGALGPMVYAGTTLFTIADQQTPQISSELWRITDSGTLEVVWFQSDQSVYDVEAYNGSAWFITGLTSMGISQNLWHVTDGGVAQSVTLAPSVIPLFLDVDAGGLHMVYVVAGGSGVQLARVNANGSLTDLLPLGQFSHIYDVIGFDGAIYFAGIPNSGAAEEQIFRLAPDGAITAIPNLVDGVAFDLGGNAPGFAISDGQLYFSAMMQVDDGFGGTTTRFAYLGLAPDGTVALISGGVPDTLNPAPVAFFDGISFGFGPSDPVLGTDTGEELVGTQRSELLDGRGGSDTLYGLNGNDTLIGGAGADLLDGGSGARDIAHYGDALAGVVADMLFGGTNTGFAQGDILVGIEDLRGTGFGDRLLGDSGQNFIWGDDGDDVIFGRVGPDRLYGGTGNDILLGGAGGDILDGGTGIRDRVQYSDATAGLRADLMTPATNSGFAAGDSFVGIEDLHGSTHSDTLFGDSAANIIWGVAGNDMLYGRVGADTLQGGLGNDTLTGGAGLDHFVFNSVLGAGNVDLLADFLSADDTVRLENAVFTALTSTGGLAAAAFANAAAASTGAHRIIYHQASGQLFYDADGNGSGVQILFATLIAGTDMSASDFLVI